MFATTFALVVALQQPPDKAFVYDAWEAWGDCGIGAIVEHESDTGGGKMKVLRTIERRTADSVTIRVVRKMRVDGKDVEESDLEQVGKPKAGDPKPDDTCGSCKKVHPKTLEESTQKVKVDQQFVDCVLIESTRVDCAGKKLGTLRRWYNRDVPGWLVKMETVVEGVRTTTSCLRFTRKK